MRLESVSIQLIIFALILSSIPIASADSPETSELDSLVEHDLIAIQGNKDFLKQAAIEGWPGSGSATDPIVISGYYFTNSDYLLRIVDTTLHFSFKKNVLDGVDKMWNGLYLSNVSHAEIVNNTFKNTRIGIYASQTQKSIITENIIRYSEVDGIQLNYDSKSNVISKNTISRNSHGGIYVGIGSRYNIVSDNVIKNNDGTGITVSHDAEGTVIRNNIILDNRLSGISVLESHTGIIDNVIVSNQNGISVSGEYCNISRNQLMCNSRNGIKVYSYTSGCVISQNSFINNKHHGITISSTCHDNRVTENDFLLNQYSPQARDSGSHNTFTGNYWNPWNATDCYEIAGEAGNKDLSPAAEPNRPVPEWLEIEPNPRLESTGASTAFMSTSIMAILLAYLASMLILDSREKTIVISMQ